MSTFLAGLPVLPVGDPVEAVRFFERVLGFAYVGHHEGQPCVRRDHVYVALVADGSPPAPGAVAAVFFVADATECYEFVRRAGGGPEPLHRTAEGGQAFRVRIPGGPLVEITEQGADTP